MRNDLCIKEWKPPKENDVRLFSSPNIVQPLHGLPPRVIMGISKWNLVRTKCYMDADYICEICRKKLGAGKCEAHELYHTNYYEHYAKFDRVVCLCSLCHNAMHTGRALSAFQKGDKLFPYSKMITIMEHIFRNIHKWNMEHITEPLIKLSNIWLDWADDPYLGEIVKHNLERFEIELYNVPKRSWSKKHWGEWKLIWEGREYPTPYQTVEEWKERYGVHE